MFHNDHSFRNLYVLRPFLHTLQTSFHTIRHSYVLSQEFLPVSPATEGRIGLIRILASVSNEDLKDKLKNLLSVKPEDLKDAAERIFQNSSNTKTTVIGDKALKKYAKNKAKKTSVIVKLPL